MLTKQRTTGQMCLFPKIGKIIERILCKRMTTFLKKFDLLNKNQSGFRPKKGSLMRW